VKVLPTRPATWDARPLWSLFTREKDVGHPDERMLSVFRDHGVVPKDSFPNLNVTAENRDIYQLVHEGWLVVNRMKAWQGAVGVSRYRGIVSGHYICFRPTSVQRNDRYLNWLVRSAPYTAALRTLSRGVRPGQEEIDNDELRGLEIVLPPIAEQERIANFLEEQVALLDSAIALRQKDERLLLERREAGILRAVVGADRAVARTHGGLAWADSTPAAWPIAKITYHARLGSGHTPSRSRPEWWQDCTIPWITTGEVRQVRDDRQEIISDTRERLSELGVRNSSAEVHPAGTVVLSRTASAGFSGVMGSDMATSQDFVTWTCEASLSPYYLLWCLRAMRPDLLGRLAMGSTHKTIYVPDIQTLRIPLPPRLEQEAVVAEIRARNASVDQLVDLGRTHMQLLAERKQALIAAAVTGRFDVTTARSVA
jgi:type I restriction enzyme, S subunit